MDRRRAAADARAADELEAALRPRGYEGVFAAKARAARRRRAPAAHAYIRSRLQLTPKRACPPRPQCRSPCEALGFPGDGLAHFWRALRLRALAPPSRAFFTAADGCTLSQCRLLARLADASAPGRPLLVCTTHLKAKAGAACDAVRLAEAQQLLSELQRELHTLPRGAAVALCGDFNTTLDAPALRALTQPEEDGSEAAEAEDVGRPRLRLHAVPLPPAADGSAFTTWKFRSPGGGSAGANGSGNGNGNGSGCSGEKAAAIDHVLHSGALAAVGAWAAPSRAEVGPLALPSEAYPSDHVAQLVELQWRDDR